MTYDTSDRLINKIAGLWHFELIALAHTCLQVWLKTNSSCLQTLQAASLVWLLLS